MLKSLFLRLAGQVSNRLPDAVKSRLYHLGPLSNWIRAVLNRAAPTGLVDVEIAGGALAGLRMRLDLQAEKDYWLGTYEMDLQQAVKAWAPADCRVIYDVGANIGYISLLFAQKFPQAERIFAFEALPNNLERLSGHIAANQLENRVQVVAGAVVDQTRSVRFWMGPSGAMGKAEGSAGRSEGHQTALDVDGIALDDFIYRDGNPAPQVLKMDIEGGEVLALKGMRRLLAEGPPLILMELHGHEAARVAWDELTQAGYSLYRMESGFPQVQSAAELDWKAYLIGQP